MTTRTRYFIIGSAFILLVGLSVGLVAYYGGLPGFAAQGPAATDLRLVPADAAVIAHVNVREVMNSEFRRKFQELQPAGAQQHGQQEFRDHTGIDIETDIESVLAFMSPGGANGKPKGVVLARGTFDEGRIRGLLAQHGARQEPYGGKTLLVPGEVKDGKEQPGALCFLEPGLVAIGSSDAVKQTVDVHRGGGAGNVLGNPDLVNLIQSVEGASNAWAVGRFDALTGPSGLPSEVARQLPAVTWFSASGRVNGGVMANLSMEAQDEQAAANLSKVIDGFVALGQLQAGKAAGGMQDVFRSLKLQTSSDGKRVGISFSVSPDLLDTLKQLQGTKGAPPVPPTPPVPPVPPVPQE